MIFTIANTTSLFMMYDISYPSPTLVGIGNLWNPSTLPIYNLDIWGNERITYVSLALGGDQIVLSITENGLDNLINFVLSASGTQYNGIIEEYDKLIYFTYNGNDSPNYATNGLCICPLSSSSVGIRISSTGVSINTPAGTSVGSNALYVTGNITASGTITAGSDYRIKEDIKPLQLEEYNVDNLNPVYFKFKESGKESIGVIAHELQEYFPFLVEGEKDGENITQTVNYNGLIGVLIKEIQELKKRVNILENKIEYNIKT